MLQQRAEQLRAGFIETATECWNALIHVNVENKILAIQGKGLTASTPDAAVPEISLDAIIAGVKSLGVFDSLVQKLAKDIDRAILKPRLMPDVNEQVAKVVVAGAELSFAKQNSDLDSGSMFKDLRNILSFLSTSLPPNVARPLSSHLIPVLARRLETHWLEPAVPVDIAGMDAFQTLLDSVSSLIDQIGGLQWDGC